MNINETPVNNAANLSMFMVNVSAKLLRPLRLEHAELSVLYKINGIRIVFPFCKSTENRHVPAPSFCFWKTIDTF